MVDGLRILLRWIYPRLYHFQDEEVGVPDIALYRARISGT